MGKGLEAEHKLIHPCSYNMGHSHKKQAREGGRDTTIMSLACQAEELGIDAKGTREPWKVWSKDRARMEH